MDATIAESTQQLLRPGSCVDLYYPDPETAKKQCFRTSVNTKYVQQFSNLGQGTSVFTIPPNNGIQDIVLVMKLPDLTGGAAGLAIPRAWGYALIKQVSYRVGGSSQYFITGAQMLQSALASCPDAAARNDLYALGGSQAASPADFAALGNSNYAYVWLKLPWTMPSVEGKCPPLPSDLLTQQTQVTVELNPIPSIFSDNGAGTPPTTLDSAEFQVQQVQFSNQGDALARRVDMTSHSLSYPCEFVQQELAVPLSNSPNPQTVSLTGFRAGEVKKIVVWITADADNTTAANPLYWRAPRSVIMTYAGDQYARYDADAGQLWNLVNSKQTPKVAGSSLAFAAGAYTSTPVDFRWLDLPFGQAYEVETAHSMYVAGKEILNGIVQLQLTLPPELVGAAGNITLHASFIYNSVLVFGSGTADFAF